jgi:hypothetical protein
VAGLGQDEAWLAALDPEAVRELRIVNGTSTAGTSTAGTSTAGTSTAGTRGRRIDLGVQGPQLLRGRVRPVEQVERDAGRGHDRD